MKLGMDFKQYYLVESVLFDPLYKLCLQGVLMFYQKNVTFPLNVVVEGKINQNKI